MFTVQSYHVSISGGCRMNAVVLSSNHHSKWVWFLVAPLAPAWLVWHCCLSSVLWECQLMSFNGKSLEDWWHFSHNILPSESNHYNNFKDFGFFQVMLFYHLMTKLLNKMAHGLMQNERAYCFQHWYHLFSAFIGNINGYPLIVFFCCLMKLAPLSCTSMGPINGEEWGVGWVVVRCRSDAV